MIGQAIIKCSRIQGRSRSLEVRVEKEVVVVRKLEEPCEAFSKKKRTSKNYASRMINLKNLVCCSDTVQSTVDLGVKQREVSQSNIRNSWILNLLSVDEKIINIDIT